MRTRREFLAVAGGAAVAWAQPGPAVFVVPNFHPASCGWLTNFSKERVYCANSYFDHLDRVRDDAEYAFVLSEVNNLVAMMNFRPERAAELRARLKEGRVELVNGFFLESTINLAGGEALVRLGVEGLRWQQAVFGVRPRCGWCIDVCGTHPQMPQIVAGLGLEAYVYCRKNPTGSAVHWLESPDGTRVLAISPGHYSELREVMAAAKPLDEKGLAAVERHLESRRKTTPPGAPILILAGSGDYALPPPLKEYPREFLRQWRKFAPQTELRFTTMARYLDVLLAVLRAGKARIPAARGGTAYDFLAFWFEGPRVKGWYRRCEHALQSAEALAAAASLRGGYAYPARRLYDAWLQMFLNMDRNTLWGAAGGMVFEHERSWDARDRFEWVERAAALTFQEAGKTLAGAGQGVALFNPANWERDDPAALPAGAAPEGAPAELLPDGRVLCRPRLPSCGVALWPRAAQAPAAPRTVKLPASIETRYYSVRFDPATGALASLRLKPSGRPILGGPGNLLVIEKPARPVSPGDHFRPRGERLRVAATDAGPVKIEVAEGPVAFTVRVEGMLAGARAVRAVRLYREHPRIDFETELNDLPDGTVTLAEFPLASAISEVRRGVPYGFSHGAWEKNDPSLSGWNRDIVPAVRWSHYEMDNGLGVGLLDRGVTGRELDGRTATLLLYNAVEKYRGYPNAWLSGAGRHRLEYALVAHEGEWKDARVPQLAWEYNCPVIALGGAAPAATWLETSGNVVVEAMRRVGRDIELRFVEALGLRGTAEVALRLPHTAAALTDMTGGRRVPLAPAKRYRVPVRPQQIVTMRFRTSGSVEEPKPRTEWDDLAPEHKRAALREYSEDKGHPPQGV